LTLNDVGKALAMAILVALILMAVTNNINTYMTPLLTAGYTAFIQPIGAFLAPTVQNLPNPVTWFSQNLVPGSVLTIAGTSVGVAAAKFLGGKVVKRLKQEKAGLQNQITENLDASSQQVTELQSKIQTQGTELIEANKKIETFDATLKQVEDSYQLKIDQQNGVIDNLTRERNTFQQMFKAQVAKEAQANVKVP